VLRRDEVVAVHLAGLQGLKPGRVVADRPNDDSRQRWLLLRVRVVPRQDDALTHGPGLELVRTGSSGMREGVGAGGPEGPGRQLALVRLVLAHRRRALHREGRQYERRDERAVAPPQLDHRDIASLATAASVERDPEAGRLVLLE